MVTASPVRARRKLWKRFLILLAILAIGLVLFYRPLLAGMADLLVLSDPVQKAQVIVALSGESNGEREAYAAELWKAGFAPKILVAGCQIAWKTIEADCMKRHLLELGVPSSAILQEKEGRNTREQAVNIGAKLRPLHVRSLILVTSPYHSRRAVAIFRNVLGSEIRVISAPVRNSSFQKEGWWTRSHDTRRVVGEYVSWVKFLMGLP